MRLFLFSDNHFYGILSALMVEHKQHKHLANTPSLLEVAESSEIEPTAQHRARKALGAIAILGGVGALGGLGGLVAAMNTDAHTEIGGTPASVRTTAQNYNELTVNGSVVTLKKYAGMTVMGQHVSAHVDLDINPKSLENPQLLPAYFSLFSDTKQITDELTSAVIAHDVKGALWGVGLAEAAYAWSIFYRRKYPNPDGTKFVRRTASGLAIASLLASVPAAAPEESQESVLQFDPRLAGTPLANVEVGGLLKPGIDIVEKYIENYVTDTNKYYDTLRSKLAEYLKANPVPIPGGGDIATFGYVADRHCNIGMDRVTVGLMNAYGIKLLVSGGDDAFSGTFDFEKGCTANLAERSKKSKIAIVAAPGNHDSAQTAADERRQGMHVLDSKPVEIDGMTFIGSPDPRGSRYGQGITINGHRANNAEQTIVTTRQAEALGTLACKTDKHVIVVAHDPNAGRIALENGCGTATLALDGHTHTQLGPTAIDLPNGATGYQYTSGTSGGAPSETSKAGTIFERVTVGPLNHPAKINIVSYDKKTGELVGITVFTFNPNMTITSSSKLVERQPSGNGTQEPTPYAFPNSDDVLKIAAR